MKKTLVIAEKPSVGREIARILQCHQKGNGCFIGPNYITTWALGHLVTLADPEAYDDRYKTWNLTDLPMLPPHMELVVMKETAKQYSIVKNLLRQPDIAEVVIATDAGREGELVARWILKKAGWRKTIKRLWISSQTDRAIQEGFRNLKPGKDFDHLYASAESRAEADWLVGLNVTRALTCKYNAQLSAGRVQTPTLALVVEREKEIKQFIPKDYWTIHATTQGFALTWKDKRSGQNRFVTKATADALIAKLAGQSGEIIDIKKEAKSELPPLAYDLTELQRDANRQYDFSAKKTSSLMQQLYENHKLVTYPRTDSRYITDDMVPTLPERLRSIAVGPYADLARPILKTKITPTKRFVDNAKVTDHHAIIPTEEYVNLGKLSSDERKIYDLIVKRFLAVLSPPFEFEQTTVTASINGELFTAKGKIVKRKGWRYVYDGHGDGHGTMADPVPCDNDQAGAEAEPDQTLPNLQKGSKINIAAVKTQAHKTKPPARYTEATLLSAMEHPGKFIEDQKLREAMGGQIGLGTPATRADIIEKLFSSFYMERKGKEIVPTSKGMQLINLVPAELKSPELTAKWEQQLTEISKGRANKDQFINEIRRYTTQLVTDVAGTNQTFRHDNLSREKCPECGKFLLQVQGKRGELLVCQDRECGYRKSVSMSTNARCPQCKKKMKMIGEGEGKTFTCICGYREKLSAFTKRNEDKKSSMKKREVSKFLQKNNDEGAINTALADALAKLKI
ncbi:DNA topoisomerase III [Heliophilum fasciatum]|uniref:DNA topoisomerase 3 n=1 Tax=Heliophilum fasciatum TaxID=35700 RepID=A0A4R2RFU4_9FIRM|nr:DNA topoisomerase III [Heliophilum fasciatum]MCW2279134.1 DNA topoisomerase-3 [Heliophilum fasciatum]TCP61219.1 DNA topoisomerase-3 [Heliophilum fasciatum]